MHVEVLALVIVSLSILNQFSYSEQLGQNVLYTFLSQCLFWMQEIVTKVVCEDCEAMTWRVRRGCRIGIAYCGTRSALESNWTVFTHTSCQILLSASFFASQTRVKIRHLLSLSIFKKNCNFTNGNSHFLHWKSHVFWSRMKFA